MAANRAIRQALEKDPRILQFLLRNVKATGKKLGKGSFGSVEELDIDGALCAGKRIYEALLEEGTAGVQNLVQRYVEECQLLSNLRHPHIVQFVGLCFFPDSSLPLLIMELLLTSLDDLLENTPDIPLAIKRSILADVAKGLAYLHNRNPPIVHRDLSAKNVLLNSAMIAKISDMGNSRIVLLQPGQLARTLSRIPGTQAYMPPEAFDSTSRYGPRLDVFSFGVLALFTLTQEFPGDLRPPNYPDPTNMDRLLARTEVERRDDYIDILHAQLGEKHPLVQLVKWCLHNIPARRPSADILIQQLEGVQIPDPYQHLTKVETMKLLRQKDGQLQQIQLDKDQMAMELQAQIQHKDTEIRALQLSKDQMAADVQHKDTENRALQEHIQQRDALLHQKDNVLHRKDEELAVLRSQQQQTSQSPSKREPTVAQEVILESEAGTHPLALQQPQEPEISEAIDAPDHTEELSVADQIMHKARVLRGNFTLLYQHLVVAGILPVLEQNGVISEAKRKEVESYGQKHAQSIVVISALFLWECPPDVLVRLTDVLAMTPGQEQVARKLLDDYNQMSRRVPTAGAHLGPPLTTPIPYDFSELSQLFQQALHSIMNAFDDIPNILGVVKEALRSLVLPLGDGKVASLVEAASYQHAQTHREVFRLMSPYWNCLSTDLLRLLTEASGCNLAAMKLSEFVQARSSKGHLSVCHSSESPGDDIPLEASISPGHRSVHTGPLEALQSLHPAVFARLPEHEAVASRNTVRITAEVNKPLLSLSDYEAVTAAVGGVFNLPQQALVYAGCSVSPIVLCWLVSADVLPYIKADNVGLSSRRLLAEQNISGIAVGDVISYKCPSIKEVELWEASTYGQIERVRDLLHTVHIDASDIRGSTALHLVSQHGQKEIAALLLSTKANVDHQDIYGKTALHWACKQGHKEVAALLLSAKATIDHQDIDGYTPLHWACQNGHTAVVSVLLEHGADPHLTTNDGFTPLHWACQFGHSAVVSVLLEYAADPHLTTNDGFTPLHWACQFGHSAVVSVLLEYAADPHLTTNYEIGPTPLMLACPKGHTTVVQLLIEAKVNVNQLSRTQQMTALITAAQNGHLETVNKLIQNGANIHMKNEEGFTALHYACQEGHSTTVSLLLEHGADLHLTTNLGPCATPLMLACLNGRSEVVDILVEAKADINQLSGRGKFTALMSAAHGGHLGILNKLIQNGANVHMKNEQGNTALDLATQNSHTEVCQVLRDQQSKFGTWRRFFKNFT